MGICLATQVYESSTKGKIKAICKFFLNIRCVLGRTNLAPYATVFPSCFLGLSDRRNLRYNLWSGKYLLHKTSRINLVRINCVPFLIFHSREVIFFPFRIEFRADLCLRLEFSARPNPISWSPSPCLPGRSQWQCRMYKEHVLSDPVERLKNISGENSSALAGCQCVCAIQNSSSVRTRSKHANETCMNFTWHVLKFSLLCFRPQALFRGRVTSGTTENGGF